MRFIGLDLAWGQKNRSGLSVIDEDGNIDLVECLRSDELILERIREISQEGAILAIDAPLVVSNDRGSRECDREVASTLGKYRAAPYSVNRSIAIRQFGAIRGEDLVHALGAEWELQTSLQRAGSTKGVIEVYPHASLVQLFGLNERIPYKKGELKKRRAELFELVFNLNKLRFFSPPLRTHQARFAFMDLDGLPGKALKEFEDKLDSLVCAYLALYWWRWGRERNDVFGCKERGFIVVPKRIESEQHGGPSAGSPTSYNELFDNFASAYQSNWQHRFARVQPILESYGFGQAGVPQHVEWHLDEACNTFVFGLIQSCLFMVGVTLEIALKTKLEVKRGEFKGLIHKAYTRQLFSDDGIENEKMAEKAHKIREIRNSASHINYEKIVGDRKIRSRRISVWARQGKTGITPLSDYGEREPQNDNDYDLLMRSMETEALEALYLLEMLVRALFRADHRERVLDM